MSKLHNEPMDAGCAHPTFSSYAAAHAALRAAADRICQGTARDPDALSQDLAEYKAAHACCSGRNEAVFAQLRTLNDASA